MMKDLYKKTIGALLVIGASFSLISCEHKPLYQKDNLFSRKVKVEIDWSALEPGDSTPDSIDMYFYNELLEDYEKITIPNDGQPHIDSVSSGIADFLFYSHDVAGVRTLNPEVIGKHSLLNEFPETNVNPIYGGTGVVDLMEGDPDMVTEIIIRPVCLNQHVNVIITNASKLEANKDMNIVSFKSFSDRFSFSGTPCADASPVMVSEFMTRTGEGKYSNSFRAMQVYQEHGFKYLAYVITVNPDAQIECYCADVTENVRKQLGHHEITLEIDFESMKRLNTGDEDYPDTPFTVQGGFKVDIDAFGDKGLTIIL